MAIHIINPVKKLLIISFSDIANDSRVLKQIYWTKDKYQLTVAGFGNINDRDIEFIQITEPQESMLKKMGRYFHMASFQFENFYWSLPFVREAYEKLKNKEFDVIIANELQCLPLSVRIKKNAHILFDAHEFYLEDISSSRLKKRIYRSYAYRMLSKYLPYVELLTSPSKFINKLYEDLFDIRTDEILNIPFYHDLEPKYPSWSIMELHNQIEI